MRQIKPLTIGDLVIEKPIIQGGMANISLAELAAAVSNAGGLGIIGSGGWDANRLRDEIVKCKKLTDKPFGVNLMLMNPHYDELAKVIVEEGVKVVTTGAGSPGPYIEMFKAAGIKIIPVVPSVALAKRVNMHFFPHPQATGGLSARRPQNSVRKWRTRAANMPQKARMHTLCVSTRC